MSQEERDAALAALIHVLEPASYPLEDYAEALEREGNDVSRAAELLLIGMDTSTRKRPRGIDQFFTKPKPVKRSPAPTASPSPSKKRPKPSPPSTPPADREAQKASWSSLLKAPAPPPPPKLTTAVKLPPLRLTSPAAIKASGIPAAMLQSPLSPAFAAQLYHVLLAESPKWRFNKFFLNGRECESNHTSATYTRTAKVFGQFRDYLLSGVPHEYHKMPPELQTAATLVEDAVNAYLDSVPRYPLEYRGRWRANMCGANRYDGAAATPTDQPGPVSHDSQFIARDTAGVQAPAHGERARRGADTDVRDGAGAQLARAHDGRLPGAVQAHRAIDLFRPQWDASGAPIPADAQETYTSRINLTFRFYRDDFLSERNPKCKCDLPMSLRADQKGKVRSSLGQAAGSKELTVNGRRIVDDGMKFFWQCQASRAGKQECGGFKVLDMAREGRGPCMIDPVEHTPDEPPDRADVKEEIAAKEELPVKEEVKTETPL